MATTTDTTNKINGAAKDFSKDFGKSVQSGSQDLGSSLENISHNVGEQAGALVSKVSGSVQDYYTDTCEFVKANPMKGVAVAAAAGIVAGSLLTMALSRRH